MQPTSSQSLSTARSAYFERSGFAPDGGYDDDWVKIDLGRFSVRFPNSSARRRAVRYHDLHHVVTGYATDLQGEAQISAWEIASSCRGFIAAWILNLLALGHVLLRQPRGLFAAFVRGRHSANLYPYVYDEALLARSVGEVREELGLQATEYAASVSDRLAFVAWASLAVVLAWVPLLAPVGLVVWWLM